MLEVIIESVKITLLVYVFMLLVELIELRLGHLLKKHLTSHRLTQYVLCAILGLIPGCNDAFVVVTLYISGIVTFGALVTVMISTFGDEAFVLLAAMADPTMAVSLSDVLALSSILLVLGIGGGALADFLVARFRIPTTAKCEIPHHDEYSDHRFNWKHFFTEHAFRHVFLRHIPTLFLWMVGSLAALHLLEAQFHLSQRIGGSPAAMIVLGCLVGLFPFSGPNLVFITLFGKGMIPLSVLLANSIVQDGHGILPLLSFSVPDSIRLKLFKLVLGLAAGFLMLGLGF